MAQNIESFGTTPGGENVERVFLAGGGLQANILTYGAILQDLRIDGHEHSVVLRAPTIEPYFGSLTYFGALVGRFANRIANGQFSMEGQDFQVPCNWINKHALHGGDVGAGQRVWCIDDVSESCVRLKLILADGDMGFPGELTVFTTISLTEGGTLAFDIAANSTATTPCSFAHHSFFNLDGGADITQHTLQINAGAYLPVDADLIPTGKVQPVEGEGFDFRQPSVIGKRGLDHNFCLNAFSGSLRKVAQLCGPRSGIVMTIETDQPGLQVYDGAEISTHGANGFSYGPFAGIALETQAWPDALNQPDFPLAILRPDDTYRHRVCYSFHSAND